MYIFDLFKQLLKYATVIIGYEIDFDWNWINLRGFRFERWNFGNILIKVVKFNYGWHHYKIAREEFHFKKKINFKRRTDIEVKRKI